jgi:probable rRNA maturation factor
MDEPDAPPPLRPSGLRVLVSDRQAEPLAGGTRHALASLAERTLAEEGVTSGELSLSFVDPGEIEDLHVRFLGEPGPTDVLSFPMDGEDGLLGDVVVCPEVAGRNNPDPASEVRLLVVHGVLHLLGYDHQEEDERRRMWALQDRYSKTPGLRDGAP